MDEDEREVRRQIAEWFSAADRQDLDGVMAQIADDVVSYEHDSPLQYRGAQAVRDVCAEGFQAAQGAFTSLEVPDMTVIVRDDIAVTWGLNHMHGDLPDGGTFDEWSRGTRVLRRQADGRWLMIHQHVSYPYDYTTGLARTDLTP